MAIDWGFEDGMVRDANGIVDPYKSRWTGGSWSGLTLPSGDAENSSARADTLPGPTQLPENFWQNLGYTGPTYDYGQGEYSFDAPTVNPALAQWAAENGYEPGWTEGWGGILKNGQVVPGSAFGNQTNDDATFIAGMLGIGGAGAAAGMFGSGFGAATPAPGTAPASIGAGTTAAETGGATLLGEAGGYGTAGSGAVSGAGGTTGTWIPGISNQSVVQGGVGLANTLIQSNANQNAIEAQRDAAAQQNALQKAQYDQTRADNAPWRAAGESALAKLSGLLQDGSLSSRFAGKLDNEAGYQFAKQEGMRAIDNSASARGGIGGAALKAGTRFAENNANNFYNDAFNRWNTENTGTYNRLSNMAGLGQVANSQVGAAGQNYANQSGNALIGLGNANAAAGINQGNIYGNLLNQGAALGNQYNWWQDARRPDINDKNPGG